MTARRFGQVKVQDGDDQTAVGKCVTTCKVRKTLYSMRLDRAGKMHMFDATLWPGWAGVGRQCEHYLESQSVNGSGAGRITACIVPLRQ